MALFSRSCHSSRCSLLAFGCKLLRQTSVTAACTAPARSRGALGLLRLETQHSRTVSRTYATCRPVFATSVTSDSNMKEVRFFPESYPEIKATSSSEALQEESDLLALLVPEDAFTKSADSSGSGVPTLGSELQELDSRLGGLLSALVSSTSFKGELDSSASGHWVGGKSKMVILVGTGPRSKDSATKAAKSAGKQIAAVAKATKSKTARISTVGQPAEGDDLELESLAHGILVGGYEATRFKAKATTSPLTTVFVHTAAENAEKQLQAGSAYGKGTLLARYLVEAPPNICTPTHIAEAAKQVQQANSDVFSIEVLEKEDCEAMGMGLYLGVSECSDEPPKFIHLVYKSPGDGDRKVVGLIGKGLTFDSGGYNLKVGGMIEMMKFDMGGAGAVFGAAHTIGMLKPPGLEIHFISASCENMISGRGMRPGDILTAANGKTVEEKCNVSKVVDVATLTGACMVALGTDMAGVFSPSKPLADSLVEASETTGERLWQLPMHKTYWQQLKSPIADMKNSGGRYAGAITAALFLEQYVDKEKVEWAHIDIAGPAWDEKQNQATGFGAAVLAKWITRECAGQA